jgi:hypothetical protein
MVATNDDLLKELQNITTLLRGLYSQSGSAEAEAAKAIGKKTVEE